MSKLDQTQSGQPQAQEGLNIGVDPLRTPILYADAIMITSSDNGIVLDIAQRVGSTNQAQVVARIGLSKEHAKTLIVKLSEQVALREGKSVTGKLKINN